MEEQEPVHLAGGPVHLEGSLSPDDQEKVRRWARENDEAHRPKDPFRVVLHIAYDVLASDAEEAQSEAWKMLDAGSPPYHPAWIGAEVIPPEPF